MQTVQRVYNLVEKSVLDKIVNALHRMQTVQRVHNFVEKSVLDKFSGVKDQNRKTFRALRALKNMYLLC